MIPTGCLLLTLVLLKYYLDQAGPWNLGLGRFCRCGLLAMFEVPASTTWSCSSLFPCPRGDVPPPSSPLTCGRLENNLILCHFFHRKRPCYQLSAGMCWETSRGRCDERSSKFSLSMKPRLNRPVGGRNHL